MDNNAAAAGMAVISIVMGLVYLIVLVVIIASMWKIYTKAGKPGWAAIVPIYNIIVLLEIIGKPTWWFVLMLIPFVNFIVAILVYVELAKVFGKSTGFAIGLLLLGPIFLPMLAFGSAQYRGVAGPGAPMPAY